MDKFCPVRAERKGAVRYRSIEAARSVMHRGSFRQEALKNDKLDQPRGLSLILVIVGPDFDHARPEPFVLCRCCRVRLGSEAIRHHLNLHVRIVQQVAILLGMLGRAAF